MKKIINIIWILFIYYVANGTMITVDQAGTGNYITIMEAVNVAVDYDTVLVYPGEYHEEVNYQGKTTVIGSLNLTTGDEQYIYSTIINGDNHRRGVTVEEYNGHTSAEGTSLIGFRITNCRENYGGGIFVEGATTEDSYLKIENCILDNNYAIYYGGGIYAQESVINVINCIVENNHAKRSGGGILSVTGSITLSGTTIRFNQAEMQFGGCIISRLSTGIFDQVNLCSIYGNYGPESCDFGKGNDLESPEYFEVYLDTFSCSEPDRYFISHGSQGDNLNWEYLDLHVNTAYYEFYDGDLYVSPDGNDENSGISPEEPMQTIAGAITKIVSNPENPNTIYMAAGTYSPELNNQLFPINMKGYVNLIGEEMDTVIWDGEFGGFSFIKDYYSEMEYEIKNITLTDGLSEDPQMLFWRENTERRKVYIQNLHSIDQYSSLFDFVSSVEFTADNIIVEGLHNNWGSYGSDPGNHSVISNSVIKNCYGMLQHIEGDGSSDDSRLDIINCMFVDNFLESNERDTYAMNIVTAGYTALTNILNGTFMNNEYYAQTVEFSTLKALFGASYNIYNTVIFGNTGYLLDVGFPSGSELSEITVSHSLMEGGVNNIYGYPYIMPYILNWLEGNLDCDPLFNIDYTPQNGSPVIDAGTLDLPYDIELPETDVYGNPRIYGNGIDIGAVEWQGTPVEFDDIVQKPMDIMVYPNPVISSRLRDGCAKIKYSAHEELDDLQCIIYNTKGQKVKNIQKMMALDNYEYFANWDMSNNAGEQVSAGVYFIRIKNKDQYVSQRKITVVR